MGGVGKLRRVTILDVLQSKIKRTLQRIPNFSVSYNCTHIMCGNNIK